MSSKAKCTDTVHSSPSFKLHVLLSQWKRDDVENELHILPSETAVTPSFILEKITKEELSEKQHDYVKKVKSYLQFDIKFIELILSQSVAHCPSTNHTRQLKDVIKETVESSMKDTDRFVRSTVREFMIAVQTLTRKCEEYRLQLKKTFYEGTFTRFISDVAVLCCLKPECFLGNTKDEPSVWENFRGLNCAISNPDIRLMKRGLPEELCCSNYEELELPVASIIEVKLPSDLRFMNEPGRHSVDDLAMNIESTRSQSPVANSLFSESTSSDNSSMDPTSFHRRKKNSSNITSGSRFLPIYKGHQVFGQHAGDLLFDLNMCLKNSDAKIGRMPGLIVDGVKVIFTLLEIKVSHLEKIRNNKELDDSDRAVIYYSIPYDIFIQADRNIILEYFMKLNNMKRYGYNDLEVI